MSRRDKLPKRDKPSKYPVGSWRWFFFDPVVPVTWANTAQAGTVSHYLYLRRFTNRLMHKFPKAWPWLDYKVMVVNMPCGCGRRPWRREPFLWSGCSEHGLGRMRRDLEARLATKKASEDLQTLKDFYQLREDLNERQ